MKKLILGILFLVGGIASFIAAPIAFSTESLNRHTFSFIAGCIFAGFAGIFGGAWLIYGYFKGEVCEDTDILDDLLREKGIDPDQIMEDIEDQRNAEGDSNAMNRIKSRYEEANERSERIRKFGRSN